jgi:hypothetical protein
MPLEIKKKVCPKDNREAMEYVSWLFEDRVVLKFIKPYFVLKVAIKP